MSQMTDPHGVPDWTLGWRLQRALAWGKVSAGQMQTHLGVSKSTISRWMNDHGAPPKRGYVVQWALRCGVPFEWLNEGVAPSSCPDEPGGAVTGWYSDHADQLATVTALRPTGSAADLATAV